MHPENMDETKDNASDVMRAQIQSLLFGHLSSRKQFLHMASQKALAVEKWDFKNIFLYELWSLTETRKLEWMTYAIKGVATSEEPDVADLDMWQIDCDIPMTNGDALKEIKVPGTEYVVACGDCSGGSHKCGVCNGKRNFLCEGCDGAGANEFSGRFVRKRLHFGATSMSTCRSRTKTNLSAYQMGRFCMVCRGLGRIDCPECNGSAIAMCHKCRGKGSFKRYLKLKIHWSVHKSCWSSAGAGLELTAPSLSEAEGDEIWQQVDEKAVPISFSSEAGVSEASQRLIEKHNAALEADPANRKIIMQRQSLRVMPLTRIDIRSDKMASPAFILGRNDKIILNPKDDTKEPEKQGKGLFQRLTNK